MYYCHFSILTFAETMKAKNKDGDDRRWQEPMSISTRKRASQLGTSTLDLV